MSIIAEAVVCGLTRSDVDAIREGKWLVPVLHNTGYIIGFRQKWEYPTEQFTTCTVPAKEKDKRYFARPVGKVCRVIVFEEDLQQLEAGMPLMTPDIFLFFYLEYGSDLLQ